MLMKIDETMESGGGDSSESRSSLSPLPLQRNNKSNFSPPPQDKSPPLGPPSISAHQLMSMGGSGGKGMPHGILASLSALNAMSSAAAAASFHHHDFGGSAGPFGGDRHSYGSPPTPMAPTNDPSANECKLVDYRGQKVAAFVINGETMLCLPQAFELFLKHLVGGLHTVYTKLKRLDIIPIVCNVEQVRILRGLGAIQPGVNRCKLLSCKDFDVLYKDCTTARPGRPPKRTSVPLVPLSQHNQFISLKKHHRLENGDFPPYESSQHNQGDLLRLEKSPLLANGYNHPPTQLPPIHFLPLGGQNAAAAAVAAHSALFSPSGLPNLPPPHPRDCRSAPLTSHINSLNQRNWDSRTLYEDFVKHFESRYGHDDCSDSEKSNHSEPHDGNNTQPLFRNGNLSGSSPVLNLSKNTGDEGISESEENVGDEDDEDDYSDNEEEEERRKEKYGAGGCRSGGDERKSPMEASHSSPLPTHFGEGAEGELGLASNETLLRNIQGLLKVAAENAKHQERRLNLEKAEMRLEVLREREVREQLEKQLVEERNFRIYYEKRWKKERRYRKKLEEPHEDSGDEPHPLHPEQNPEEDSPTHPLYSHPHQPQSHHHHHHNQQKATKEEKKRSNSPGEKPPPVAALALNGRHSRGNSMER